MNINNNLMDYQKEIQEAKAELINLYLTMKIRKQEEVKIYLF